jgi:hypothetical protein
MLAYRCTAHKSYLPVNQLAEFSNSQAVLFFPE